MVDLREALRPLIDRPTAAPEPLEALQVRTRQRRRRRRVSLTAALASAAAIVVTAVVMWSGRDNPKQIEAVGPGKVESRIEPGEPGRKPNPPVVVAAGEMDGQPWQLRAHESDTGLCVGLLGGGLACFDVSTRHALGVAVDATVTEDSTGTARPRLEAVYGPVSRDVARVAIRLASGKVVETPPVGQDAGFVANFFVYVAQAPTDLPFDDQLSAVVAYDANGNELDRLEPVCPLPDLAGDAAPLAIRINAVDPCG